MELSALLLSRLQLAFTVFLPQAYPPETSGHALFIGPNAS